MITLDRVAPGHAPAWFVAHAYTKLPRRWLAKIRFAQSGCWEWLGPLSEDGYAMLKHTQGHRKIYELLIGPIPGGLTLDHLCRVRSCINPGHLEPVTVRENNLRGVGPSAVNAGKTECVNGHPFNASNTYVYVGRSGSPERACIECRRQAVRRHRAKRKVAQP